jgi:hypothetical protein
MRRVFALCALSILAAGSAAQAETWKAYTTPTPTNLQWSYDTDYSYRDAQSKRVVALTAIGKLGATPRMGPSSPGAADGVGSVVALDCKSGNMILLGGYAPAKPLAINDTWRATTPKKIDSAEDKALQAAVCPGADKLPTK